MPEKLTKNIASMVYELCTTLDLVDREAIRTLVELILESPAVFFAGAGRSGLLLRCTAMRLMHLGLRVHVVGDTLTPAITAGDLLLVGSGSGETAGLIGMVEKAKQIKATVALVTANRASTIADKADLVVTVEAPTPKADITPAILSAQPMGSLFEQSMFLLFEAVVMDMMQRRGANSADMFKKHANLE